tara:strand:+ start:673 stop:1647 length:975 start_codon:yes stop_codon:yes gene_type:complete
MSIKYKTVSDLDGNEFDFPELSEQISSRLANPGRLYSDVHCAKSLGESILRQLSEERHATGGLRLSQSGACIKQLAYQYHHYKTDGMQIGAASKIAFTIGDITEAIIVSALAECFDSPKSKLMGALTFAGSDQETVHMDVTLGEATSQTAKIPGHPDGTIGFMDSEMNARSAILEVKSMSDYGYRKFVKEGLGRSDSYYSQVQSYMHCKGLKWTYLVAYNKSAGARDAEVSDNGDWFPVPALSGQWIPYDEEHALYIQDKFRQVIQSKSAEDFARPYSSNKKGQLAFPCDYCSYFKTCFPLCSEEVVESKWLTKSTKIKVIAGE